MRLGAHLEAEAPRPLRDALIFRQRFTDEAVNAAIRAPAARLRINSVPRPRPCHASATTMAHSALTSLRGERNG
jgi:hypothetical protein